MAAQKVGTQTNTKFSALFAAFLCLSTAQTGSAQTAPIEPELAARPQLPAKALAVPMIHQSTDYSCGAAALLSTLVYWSAYDGTESDLFPLLKTTQEDGTEPDKIAEVAELYGLKSSVKLEMSLDDLRRVLQRGETAILDIQAWPDNKSRHLPWTERWEDGHYIVLLGMDDRYAYFMDPSIKTGYGYIQLAELMDRWHDYEDRSGTLVRNYRLGIIIHGKGGMKTFPAPLSRIN